MTMMASEPRYAESHARELIVRLQRGQDWLTKQSEYRTKGYTAAAGDDVFNEALATWTMIERILRADGFKGCIWQQEPSCPSKALLKCQVCFPHQLELWR